MRWGGKGVEEERESMDKKGKSRKRGAGDAMQGAVWKAQGCDDGKESLRGGEG